MSSVPTRRQLYRWIGWFFLANALLGFCIIFYYHDMVPHFEAVHGATTVHVVIAKIFFALTFFVQSGLVMYAGGLVVFFIATLFPRRYVVYPIAMVYATVVLFGFVGDAVTYGLYYQHYGSLAINIYKAGAFGDVVALGTPEKIIIVSIIAGFLCVEYALAWFIWWQLNHAGLHHHIGYTVAGFLLASWFVTYGFMLGATRFAKYEWLSPTLQHEILKAARTSPYFSQLFDFIVPGDSSVRHILVGREKVPVVIDQLDRPLNYPLKPLQCQLPVKPLNVLIIGIDTWRYSALNKDVTPHIFQFAKKTIQFDKHFSGGNCTRPGVFSLFYGLPSNYWRAFLSQHISPVLIDKLLEANYQMAIYTSAPLTFPAFNQSVFEKIQPLVLRISGNSSIERDQKVTREFSHFLKNRNPKRPFFGFLFYDAIHNYCEPQVPNQTPFKPYIKECNRISLTKETPRIPYLNRYRNAAHFDDKEVGQVLAQLKNHHLLKNTVVIITSDHGEQINDEGMNIWVHASAYTKYQLHVPMLIYWPGKASRRVNYFTTHNDVPPTLLKNVLGCTTPAHYYSVGHSLFNRGSQQLLIAGSYGDYAVVTPQKVTRIYPNGDYQVDDPRGRIIPGAVLDPAEMKTVYNQLMRFFKDKKHAPLAQSRP